MTSLLPSRPVSSALRKQSTAPSLYLQATQFSAPRNCRSSLSSLCPQSRSIQSQSPIQSPRLNSSLTHPTQQRRTFLVQLRRQAQILKEATTPPPEPQPQPQHQPQRPVQPEPTNGNLRLTNLPYFVRRTGSNQLPVYLVTKAGGTKQQTKIQKGEGNMDALASDLSLYLDNRSPKPSEVTVNRLTGHVIVKGWRKPEIIQFLKERNF